MSRVYVCGLGAVSPAGWGVAALAEALAKGEPLPIQPLERPGWTKPLRMRPVPAPPARLPFLAHPRLRRTSPITHYAAAAALEAVAAVRARPVAQASAPAGKPGVPTGGSAAPGGETPPEPAGADACPTRLGVVLCLQSGCVQFSCRFFTELVQDPATASPLLFPETVFAAPASHVAALLGNTPLVHTLQGDPAGFLQGVALAIVWLEERQVDACLVVGAEEINWLLADALWHLEHQAIISGGAGALCLTLDPAASLGIELAAITDAHTYRREMSRAQAASQMRAQLPRGRSGELLCDGLSGSGRADAAERAAWRDWRGLRLSPKRVLGEGLMAAGAWQCVAACCQILDGGVAAANVSLVGSNQQAIGARFVRPAA